MTDPTADRTVQPSVQHRGMTQISRGGRCFQVAGVGPGIVEMLECHAECVATGVAVPDYGRRWPDRGDEA